MPPVWIWLYTDIETYTLVIAPSALHIEQASGYSCNYQQVASPSLSEHIFFFSPRPNGMTLWSIYKAFSDVISHVNRNRAQNMLDGDSLKKEFTKGILCLVLYETTSINLLILSRGYRSTNDLPQRSSCLSAGAMVRVTEKINIANDGYWKDRQNVCTADSWEGSWN